MYGRSHTPPPSMTAMYNPFSMIIAIVISFTVSILIFSMIYAIESIIHATHKE